MRGKTKLIVALDVDTLKEAERLVGILYPTVNIFKVGSQLFTTIGPEVVKMIAKKGARVFLDLKFHDIPNTVAKAVESARALGIYILTVHTLGGRQMLKEAAAAARDKQTPLIIGVTLLTSMDKKVVNELGIKRSLTDEVIALAKIAKQEGLQGIVCSAQEIEYIRRERGIFGEDFIIVTPGIRPKGYPSSDQSRVATPREAARAGADYIVVGRPIIKAEDPLGVAQDINKQISNLL